MNNADESTPSDPMAPVDEGGNTAGVAQWAADPFGRYELRYFDGAEWTAHVSTNGVVGADPIPQR